MLITEKLSIRIGNTQQRNWYRNKGYNCNIKDIIVIEPKELPDQSIIKVDVKCDYCGK